MKKKIVWLVVTGLMVVALLLASCTPAVTEEEEKVAPPKEKEEVAPPKEKGVVVPEKGVEMVKLSLTKHDGTVVEKIVEKPRYGGVLIQALPTPIIGHDAARIMSWYTTAANAVIEVLVLGDWKRGQAGTGEQLFVGGYAYTKNRVGLLAESWEFTEPETIVYHIRKGVHFQNKPPVNGREMTAYDVAYSMDRQWDTPTAYVYGAYPRATNIEWMGATDKWTFVFKAKPGMLATVLESPHAGIYIIPPEVIDKYGSLEDNRAVIGTGPFMLTDHIPSVSTTLVRNPDYWGKHPLYPEDTMPYLDGVKYLIIPDLSTRMAALRTGKVDIVRDLVWEDAESLRKTTPELKWAEWTGSSEPAIAMRLDKPELPTSDVRVRRALSMGINRQAIKDLFYSGYAHMISWPFNSWPEYADVYTPLEKQTEEIKEIWGYNPEKAKQLLAEAGYPQGFKTEIVTQLKDVDLLSIVKEDWAKIGVDAKLDVKEYAIWSSLQFKRTYSHMLMSSRGPGIVTRVLTKDLRFGSTLNYSNVNDPFLYEQELKVGAAFPDDTKRFKVLADVVPYILSQVYYIGLPTPKSFVFFQPWVKDYHGESVMGNGQSYDMYNYIWYDQDLKEKMTGRR